MKKRDPGEERCPQIQGSSAHQPQWLSSLTNELLAIEKRFWLDGPSAYHQHADAKCLLAFAELTCVKSKEQIPSSVEKGRWTNVSI
jgi:hypothetical protein